MIISKKRINSVDKYVASIANTSEIYIGVSRSDDNMEFLLKKAGIKRCAVGNAVIPNIIGPVTRFNLIGKDIILKDKPKESRLFSRAFHCVDWHGNDHYGICFQTRQCYPRRHIEGPMEELLITKEYIISRRIRTTEGESLKHIINLFLETFGYCEILNKNAETIDLPTKVNRVNWTILPPGKYPWKKSKVKLAEYFEKVPKKKRAVVESRHKEIAEISPDFLAIGENSFNGYVVYGYNSKNLYIFEANEANNATYIFRDSWENVSQLTKKEIIEGEKCYRRLVHNENWIENIRGLLLS